MRAQESILRPALFINHWKYDRRKPRTRRIKVAVRRKMYVTIFAQLIPSCDRAISLEVECFHARLARCDGQNLIGLPSRKRQSWNRKLTIRGARQMFDPSCRIARICHRSTGFQSRVVNREHRIRDYCNCLRRQFAIRQVLTLHSKCWSWWKAYDFVIKYERAIRYNWQCRKWHILQRTVRNNHKSFLSELSSSRRKYDTAQLSRSLLKPRICLRDSRSLLLGCFKRLNDTAGHERLRNLSRNVLYLLSFRQLKRFQRIRGYNPKIAPLLAESVFEQHSVWIQLLLNLFQAEWLRLSQSWILRAVFTNRRLHLLILIFERADFSLQRSNLFSAASACLERHLTLSLGVYHEL